MTDILRYVTRGLLRLTVLTLPAFLVLGVLNRRSDPSVSWVDTHAWVGEDDSTLSDVFGTPRPGTRLDLASQPSYSVQHASVGLWLLSLVTPFLVAAAMSAVALLLLRTLHDTDRGEPFGPAAARRLRAVALVIGAVGLAGPLLSTVAGRAVVATVTPDHADSLLSGWNPFESLPWLVAALLLLVVADAFGIGSRLADDVEGLV